MVKSGGGRRRFHRQHGLQVLRGDILQRQHLPVAFLQVLADRGHTGGGVADHAATGRLGRVLDRIGVASQKALTTQTTTDHRGPKYVCDILCSVSNIERIVVDTNVFVGACLGAGASNEVVTLCLRAEVPGRRR